MVSLASSKMVLVVTRCEVAASPAPTSTLHTVTSSRAQGHHEAATLLFTTSPYSCNIPIPRLQFKGNKP